MSTFGHESSEQLHYIPARLEVHETQRLKYSCGHCHGAVVRAQMPVLPPIPKSMASAGLLAYLIVSKFADGQERAVPLLERFKAWLDNAVHSVLPKDSLGEAVHYALKHWSALTKFTEAGRLDASNNYAERFMRAVAIGRKAFLFVGSERAGHAAAIYYSLVESCKANEINPLTYLTYILSNVRNRAMVLPTPDEFASLSTASAGGCAL